MMYHGSYSGPSSDFKQVDTGSSIRNYIIRTANTKIETSSNSSLCVSVFDIARGDVSKDLIDIHEYAAMSAHAYDLDDTEKASVPVPEGWSDTGKKFRVKLRNAPYRIDLDGLEYKIFENSHKKIINIAFRGTEDGDDWRSNFHWFNRLFWFMYDQYDQTAEIIPQIVKKIKADQEYSSYRIVASGHSLGGGLAQHAAYNTPEIKLVYAFDPSSVTGYWDVSNKRKEASVQGMRTYRIFEHGEVLAYLRFIMKGFFTRDSKNPEIIELRYNLMKGNVIEQHDMTRFSKKLVDIHQAVKANR